MDIQNETALRDSVRSLVSQEHDQGFTGGQLDDYEQMIIAAQIIQDEGRIGLRNWVRAGRRAGLSWSRIGELLDISKQAAQQRFGAGVGEQETNNGGIIRVPGATAFNEMNLLAKEGDAGRELIEVGMATLFLRQTEQIWEHRRAVSLIGPDRTMLADEGWTYVCSWFPFHYFKRTLRSDG